MRFQHAIIIASVWVLCLSFCVTSTVSVSLSRRLVQSQIRASATSHLSVRKIAVTPEQQQGKRSCGDRCDNAFVPCLVKQSCITFVAASEQQCYQVNSEPCMVVEGTTGYYNKLHGCKMEKCQYHCLKELNHCMRDRCKEPDNVPAPPNCKS
jgi:hypothetical protein